MPNPYRDPKNGQFTFKGVSGLGGTKGRHSFSKLSGSGKHRVSYIAHMGVGGSWMVSDPTGRKDARNKNGSVAFYKTEKSAQKRADSLDAETSSIGEKKFRGPGRHTRDFRGRK